MNHGVKKIGVVLFGSIAVAVAVTIIGVAISFPLGVSQQAQELLFGEWAMLVRTIIAALAFPILWRYMKIEKNST